MPSKEPAIWRADVERSRRGLLPGQALVVSVVASPEANWTLADIVADFTQLARWAKAAGAHAVEANLSCPNVCSQEGQLYTSPRASAEIAAAMHAALGATPLVLKIGLFAELPQAAEFVEAVQPYAAALSTVNSVSAVVLDGDQHTYFEGNSRGIGGECIRERCQSEAVMLASVLRTATPQPRLIGVGGVSSADDFRLRLSAGAHHVQIAIERPELCATGDSGSRCVRPGLRAAEHDQHGAAAGRTAAGGNGDSGQRGAQPVESGAAGRDRQHGDDLADVHRAAGGGGHSGVQGDHEQRGRRVWAQRGSGGGGDVEIGQQQLSRQRVRVPTQ
ncbi:MAG: hypothetical protein FJW40_26705 [Acidobacteria bacterium]|nr:hypothetical protein [Acidobacteriota bacterium]